MLIQDFSFMTKKKERQEWILQCLNFASGNMGGDIPDRIENFIDARSRTYELYQVKALKRARKPEAIEYFINLSRAEKAKLIEANNQLIIALPFDVKTLDIPRPEPVRYQSSSFGGKSVEYPVFSMLEVIGLWNTYFQVKLNP